MRNVLIAGFPKSGNTWLTRLLAYGFNAPLRDLHVEQARLADADRPRPGYDSDELQGRMTRPDQPRRVSHVLKTHEQADRFWDAHRPVLDALGYARHDRPVLVTRDPKDVVVSTFHYRFFTRPQAYGGWLGRMPRSVRQVYFGKLRFGALAREIVSEWRAFTRGWLSQGPVVVRYEAMLDDTAGELERLCASLELPLEPEWNRAAVEFMRFDRQQEREKRRRPDARDNELFFRKGEAEQWREMMNPSLARELDDQCRAELRELGYRR